MKIPILFLIFNRKDVSVEAFKTIKKYQPVQLFIAADGPRLNKKGEKDRCYETRKAILDMIDWKCDVKTLFRDHNLGCANAVNEAICWFFNNVELGIIIEDDVVVSDSFFIFCETLLPKYKDDDRIAMITSQCLLPEKDNIQNEYTFSNSALIWGWATWKRAWEGYMDMTMSRWPKYSLISLISELGIFQGIMYKHYWSSAYRQIMSNRPFNSWATRWFFNILSLNKLSIVPMTNLSKNIGCSGVGGAHYESTDIDPYEHIRIHDMIFPLKDNDIIKANKLIMKAERDDFYRVRMIGLRKKIRKIFNF